jgi:GDP-L-fucose synthase
MKNYSGDGHINIGSGKDLSILELTKLICDVVGFVGALRNDLSKPDGTPQKLLSVERLSALGWAPRVSLREGLKTTYEWFKENVT